MLRVLARTLKQIHDKQNLAKFAPLIISSGHNLKWYSSKPGDDDPSKYLDEEEKTEDEKTYDLITSKYFKVDDKEKNKKSFEGAIDIFTHKDSRRRGQVEFIYSALKNMQHFGVHKDLGSYKKLLGVLPTGKYVPENRLQADFFHFPKQQDCAVKIMVAMEKNGVMPDEEFGDMILLVFGKISNPFKKYCRMMYWMPKLKNISPWLLPETLPDEALELAKLGIQQIMTVDPLSSISVYQAEDLHQSTDKTWIVSGQSEDQKELLASFKENTPIYVEGAFRLWLKDNQVNYFILRGPPLPAAPPITQDEHDLTDIRMWMDGEKDTVSKLERYPTVHEQPDGTILAVAATGTSSRESLLSWIRFLEKENPVLSDLAILFTLQSPLGPVIPVEESSELRS